MRIQLRKRFCSSEMVESKRIDEVGGEVIRGVLSSSSSSIFGSALTLIERSDFNDVIATIRGVCVGSGRGVEESGVNEARFVFLAFTVDGVRKAVVSAGDGISGLFISVEESDSQPLEAVESTSFSIEGKKNDWVPGGTSRSFIKRTDGYVTIKPSLRINIE